MAKRTLRFSVRKLLFVTTLVAAASAIAPVAWIDAAMDRAPGLFVASVLFLAWVLVGLAGGALYAAVRGSFRRRGRME
jgi:hypothetical protein